MLDGITVTGPARTLLDLAGVVGDRLLFRMIEHARRTSLVTWTDLAEVLATHARRGRPGIRRLRRVILANADREEVTDTDMELLVLLGWNVLRFSHKRVATRAGSVVREVRDALAGS